MLTMMMITNTMKKNHFRTIWISDVHLGTRGCKYEYLLHFLQHNEAETLYLVGDIIDGWRIKYSFFWNQGHNEILREILKKSKKGTQVYYIAGNHDDFLRDFLLEFSSIFNFGNITITNSTTHNTADGRNLWVVHGDDFDGVTKYHKWVALLGDHAYTALLYINRHFNKVRELFGYRYWSLSKYIKHKAKSAVSFIFEFEKAIATECTKLGHDGVVCGHIHHAEARLTDSGIWYYNCGDWVESCTALVEDFEGMIKVLEWHKK